MSLRFCSRTSCPNSGCRARLHREYVSESTACNLACMACDVRAALRVARIARSRRRRQRSCGRRARHSSRPVWIPSVIGKMFRDATWALLYAGARLEARIQAGPSPMELNPKFAKDLHHTRAWGHRPCTCVEGQLLGCMGAANFAESPHGGVVAQDSGKGKRERGVGGSRSARWGTSEWGNQWISAKMDCERKGRVTHWMFRIF